MKIHREGTNIILFTTLVVAALNVLSFAAMGPAHFASWFVLVLSLTYLFLSVYFFRIPVRVLSAVGTNGILSPADGKVVVIEKIREEKYFHEERLQVSIFMSPLDVHINWYPLSGKVVHSEYTPGKYYVAWHPKSSYLNESHSTILEWEGQQILVKQIAGAVARRVVNYARSSAEVEKGDELGFIKFGSRVDLLLPTDARVVVELGQKVSGLETLIAELKSD